MASPIVILTDVDHLRKLAKLIYYQEADSIKGIKFNSEPELAQYLRDCQANYKSVLGHLDKGVELKRKFENDQTRSPIANDIFLYIVYCANSALQTVRNYTVRMSYLGKISDHVKELIKRLQEVDTGNVTDIQSLAEEVKQYKEAMFKLVNKHRSNESNNFSQSLKDKGISFDELVQRQMTTMGLDGEFKHLNELDKIRVYDNIIEASGRGGIMNKLVEIGGIDGIPDVFLFASGLMVWNIVSATGASIELIAGVTQLGQFTGVALPLAELFSVGTSSTFVAMAGFVSSIAGAFLIGSFGGLLIDSIIGSGGCATLSSTNGLCCYVTSLPDGEVLARQILRSTKK